MKQNLPNQHVSTRETWELLREIKQIISRKEFMDCLVIGASQENRYCQDPRHPDYRRNPVDRIRNLVSALILKEAHSLAHTLVNHIAEPLACRLAPINEPIPDKENLYEECIDDYCAKTKLDEMIRAGESMEVVMQQADMCKREIEETIVLYREHRKNTGRW